MSEHTQPLNYHTYKAWRFEEIAAQVDREVAIEMGTPRPKKPREPKWENPVVPAFDVTMTHLQRLWAGRDRAYNQRRAARGNLNNSQVCMIRKAVAAADFSPTEIRRQARKYGVSGAVVKELLASWRNSPQWDQ